MKVLKKVALGLLLAGASLGASSVANAYGYGYGYNGCNTCARPACNTCGFRLFNCNRCNTCNTCNTCRAYVPGRYVAVGCSTVYRPGYYVNSGF